MDIAEELIKFIWKDSLEGHFKHKKIKEEENPDGFISSSGACTHCLTHDDRFPKEDPPEIPVEGVHYKKDQHGVIEIDGGKALTGDYITHKYVQSRMKAIPDFIQAERKVDIQEDDIFEIGHIDLEIIDSTTKKRQKVPVDMKGCTDFVIPYITGQRKAGEHTYTFWKRKRSIIQTNEYAISINAPFFYIVWMALGNLGLLKVELFFTDDKMHRNVIRMRQNVKEALKNNSLPEFEGVCYCELGKKKEQCYCRHYKDGSTGKFPKKSGANCPGKTKLLEAKNHQDLLQISKEARDFEGEY